MAVYVWKPIARQPVTTRRPSWVIRGLAVLDILLGIAGVLLAIVGAVMVVVVTALSGGRR